MNDELVDKLQKVIGPPTVLELVYSYCSFISVASSVVLVFYGACLGLTFIILGEAHYRLALSFVAAIVLLIDAIRWIIWRRLRKIQHGEETD